MSFATTAGDTAAGAAGAAAAAAAAGAVDCALDNIRDKDILG